MEVIKQTVGQELGFMKDDICESKSRHEIDMNGRKTCNCSEMENYQFCSLVLHCMPDILVLSSVFVI